MICSRNPVSLHDMFEETQPPTVIYFSKSVLQVLLLCIYPYVLQRLQKQPSGRVLSTLSENPSKFTRKHLCRRFCLIMLQTYRLCSITKKRIPHMCFTEIFKNDLAWKVFKYGVFLVRIFLYSVRLQKNTGQKKPCVWTLFMQWPFVEHLQITTSVTTFTDWCAPRRIQKKLPGGVL